MREPVLTGQVLGPQQLGSGLLVLTQPDEGVPVHGQRRGERRRPRHPVGHRQQRRQDRAGALGVALPSQARARNR